MPHRVVDRPGTHSGRRAGLAPAMDVMPADVVVLDLRRADGSYGLSDLTSGPVLVATC